jgi:hypothetical protein
MISETTIEETVFGDQQGLDYVIPINPACVSDKRSFGADATSTEPF